MTDNRDTMDNGIGDGHDHSAGARSATATLPSGRGVRRHRKAGALLASLPIGAAGFAAVALGGAAPASAGTGSAPSFPAPPGSGASTSDWQSWAAQQQAAVESVPWSQLLTSAGCEVASIAFPTFPADIGLPGAPAGVSSTGLDVVAKCPTGVSPLSVLAGTKGSLRAHSVPTGNTCGSVYEGSQCVEEFSDGGVYVESGYTNGTSSTIDGYEELSVDGATATSCSTGSEVGQNPSSGYLGLPSGYTDYFSYGPISADNVWDGTWWKGSGTYYDTGDVCTYI